MASARLVTQKGLEFSVSAMAAREGGCAFSLAANQAERAELASRFGLVGVESFEAEGEVMAEANGDLTMQARIRARFTQTCVVSLEPVDGAMDEKAIVRFVPAAKRAALGKESHLDAEEDEEIEPFDGDVLHIGAVLAEQFGVGLDPYPRKEGASAPDVAAKSREGGEVLAPRNPFAILGGLKGRG